MEITSFFNQYLDPMLQAPELEVKPLKTPTFEQDVQRFEAVLSGEGPYQPNSIDLVMPATEPNAIDNMNQTLITKVSKLKNNMDRHIGSMEKLLNISKNDEFTMQDSVNLMWDMTLFSIENTVVSKVGEKSGEAVKTLFRNQ